MSLRSSLTHGLNLALLLTYPVAQALPSHQAPIQFITKLVEPPYNVSAVPGASPVKYHNDPSEDLFKIESLDMHPNPCVIESYCSVIIRGEFTTSLTNTTPHVSFNVTSHFQDGRTGLVPGEDAFCHWVDIVQDQADDDTNNLAPPSQSHRAHNSDNHHESLQDFIPDAFNPIIRKQKKVCPPVKGKAQITYTVLLLGGWVPETNVTVKVKATEEGKGGEEGRTIFDLGSDFELKYKDGYVPK